MSGQEEEEAGGGGGGIGELKTCSIESSRSGATLPREGMMGLGKTEGANVLFWGGTGVLSTFFIASDVEEDANGEGVCELDEATIFDLRFDWGAVCEDFRLAVTNPVSSDSADKADGFRGFVRLPPSKERGTKHPASASGATPASVSALRTGTCSWLVQGHC